MSQTFHISHCPEALDFIFKWARFGFWYLSKSDQNQIYVCATNNSGTAS
ncbi:MAG: hypothetical protein SH817_08020 [Leptospira sp.]|nr:hypothetical protein [Leptospira sp.]